MLSNDLRPENLSFKELAHYGLQHDDPWVRRLASAVETIAYFLDQERWDEGYLDEYLDDLKLKEKNLKWELERTEETVGDLEEELHRATDQVKSLQYDLSSSRQEEVIRGLKARIHEKNTEHFGLQETIKRLQGELAQLKQNHQYLIEKHNTWTVIAS